MAKLRFDDTDYSVVVKSRAPPPNSWRWEIYRAGRSSPIGQAPIFFHTIAAANKAGKSSTQAAVGQAQRLTGEERRADDIHVTDFGREEVAVGLVERRIGIG